MSISGKFINLKGTAVTIGGVNHARFNEEAGELDKASGASAGYGDRDSGVLDCTITFGGWIDVGAANFPGGITTGATLANANIPLGTGGANILITMPSALVLSFQAGGETRGRLEFECTVKNKGSYTINTV